MAKPKRVALVFSGGPAPGANAVISTVASAFRRAGWDVYGLLHGYSGVSEYDGDPSGLVEGVTYRDIQDADLRGLRNARGVFLGTARVNPGRGIRALSDLRDPERSAGLRRVYQALVDLEVEALVSIGGDGTLITANLLHLYQQTLVQDAPRVRVVHVPKTIDNDYGGIDFTFGFFTAVDEMARQLRNLRADAVATGSYYIVSTMGRRAGWLAYGVAVAGEAHLVVGVEDVCGELAQGDRLNLDVLVDRVVDLIETRARRGKSYGTVVLAEGLTELLPDTEVRGVERDDFGRISFAELDLSKLVASRVSSRHRERFGNPKKVVGVQLGYESRCAAPHAFDVMLGAQLGLGAYRSLVESDLDGHMVSVRGQLELCYVPFSELIDSGSLLTEVRLVQPQSDFHRMATELGTRIK